MNRLDIEKENIGVLEIGTLRSVDFSRIYSLSRVEKQVSLRRPYAETPSLVTRHQPRDLSGLFRPLLVGEGEKSHRPVLRGEPRLVESSRSPVAVSLPPLVARENRKKKKTAAFINLGELPEPKSYSVQTSPGVVPSGNATGQLELEIPLGMPRFLNVRTLKAMLRASSRDPMFRKVGERWEVCADSFEVDLHDRSQVFRLGKLQIFS